MKSLSCVRLFVTPWTVAYQAPLSIGFSRQEYWSGLLSPPPVIFPTQGSNPGFDLMSPALAGFYTTSTTWEACAVSPILKTGRLRPRGYAVTRSSPHQEAAQSISSLDVSGPSESGWSSLTTCEGLRFGTKAKNHRVSFRGCFDTGVA